MKKFNNFLISTAVLFSISLHSIAAPDGYPCWQTSREAVPEGTLCWFDGSQFGIGWQLGVTTLVSIGQELPKIYCSQILNQGAPFIQEKFAWFLLLDVEPLANNAELKNGQNFISLISSTPYCKDKPESGQASFPQTPQEMLDKKENAKKFCLFFGPSESVGLGEWVDADSTGKCEDAWGIHYNKKTGKGFSSLWVEKLSATHQGSTSKSTGANWQKQPYAGWAYFFDDGGKRVQDHYDCPNHCRAHAEERAEALKHKFFSYDGDHYFTGTDIDRSDIDHGKNEVYENLNAADGE